MPRVKFDAPSGFTKLIMTAPATQINIPKTIRMVGFCFKKIQANNAPNNAQVAEIGMADAPAVEIPNKYAPLAIGPPSSDAITIIFPGNVFKLLGISANFPFFALEINSQIPANKSFNPQVTSATANALIRVFFALADKKGSFAPATPTKVL